MKLKRALEKEKEFRLYFLNDEGDDEDYTITYKYDEENKVWRTNLSGEYDEKELDAVKKILSEINENHKEPIEIVFDKEMKEKKK